MYYIICLFVFSVISYYSGSLLALLSNRTGKRQLTSVGIRKVMKVPCNMEGGIVNGTWYVPETSRIMLRDKGYTRHGRKIACNSESLFEPIDMSIYVEDSGRKKISHVAYNIPEVRGLLEEHADSWFLIITWILPAEPYLSVVMILRRRQLERACTPADRILSEFIHGTDVFRKERFKFIPRVERCSPILRKGITLLGGERPTLICRKIANKFFRGDNYLELDINISSSSAAKSLSNLLLPAMKNVSILFAFTIEGRDDDELPEELLGAMAVTNVDFRQIVDSVQCT